MQKNEQWFEQLKNELNRWHFLLDTKVGVFTYLLGIACLGTNHPQKLALLSFLVISFLFKRWLVNFPKQITELREKKKTEKEAIYLAGIEATYLSKKGILNNCPVFVIGWFFLAVIACGIIK